MSEVYVLSNYVDRRRESVCLCPRRVMSRAPATLWLGDRCEITRFPNRWSQGGFGASLA